MDHLKLILQTAVPLPGEAFLIFAGLGCYLLTTLLARRQLNSAVALVPGLIISFLIEGADIFDHYGASGLSGNDGGQLIAIAARHFKDVLIFNFAPVSVVLVAKFCDRNKKR